MTKLTLCICYIVIKTLGLRLGDFPHMHLDMFIGEEQKYKHIFSTLNLFTKCNIFSLIIIYTHLIPCGGEGDLNNIHAIHVSMET